MSYGSYGAFKRLGLSTTSHVEPKMSQNEWRSVYGTSNNLDKPRHLLHRPTPPPRPRRTESGAATVSAMVAAAHVLRRSNAAQGSPRRGGRPPTEERKEEQTDEAGSDDDGAQFSSDDDADGDERPVESGVERQARAERRVSELRKRHRADQGKHARLEKTKRTRTLRRSTSDVELPVTAPVDPLGPSSAASSTSTAATTAALPTLRGAAVRDVRERTRLLLRDALRKMDPEYAASSAAVSSPSPTSPASGRRQARPAGRKGEEGEKDEEKDEEEEEEEEDAHALLASDIEQELFEHHQSAPSTAYRQHSRDLIFALVNNPRLAPGLLSLGLSPASLVSMQPLQLANHSLAVARAKEKAEMTRDLVLGQAEGVRSDEWLCEGCGGRATETFVLKEGRDLRKAEVWGGGGEDVKILLVRCLNCRREWKKEV